MSTPLSLDQLTSIFEAMEAEAEAFVDLLGLELRWTDTSGERRYWIINPRTGRTVLGGKKGRDSVALEYWLEDRRDDLAKALGFTNAVALRRLAHMLTWKAHPRTAKEYDAFDYFIAEARMTAIYRGGA